MFEEAWKCFRLINHSSFYGDPQLMLIGIQELICICNHEAYKAIHVKPFACVFTFVHPPFRTFHTLTHTHTHTVMPRPRSVNYMFCVRWILNIEILRQQTLSKAKTSESRINFRETFFKSALENPPYIKTKCKLVSREIMSLSFIHLFFFFFLLIKSKQWAPTWINLMYINIIPLFI